MRINDFQNKTNERDFHWDPDGVLDIVFRAVELAGEVGEACNIIKKLERERLGLRGSRSTKEALAEELGDIFICLMLLANAADVNLEDAAIKKFNASSEKMDLPVFI